jgi:hypothetical protein
VKKIILVGIVTLAVGLILAATAWNFNAVASLPEEYMRKDEAQEQHKRIETKLDRIIDHLLRRDHIE